MHQFLKTDYFEVNDKQLLALENIIIFIGPFMNCKVLFNQEFANKLVKTFEDIFISKVNKL